VSVLLRWLVSCCRDFPPGWQAQRQVACQPSSEVSKDGQRANSEEEVPPAVVEPRQELEAEAQGIVVRRAAPGETTPQAVEACETGTLRAIQTGSANEDRCSWSGGF